jgi:hypothetical protein
MLQSRISALENVNYSAWSISTLRRLAKAFNVVLVVRFESFGKHLQEIEDFGRESLKVDSFASDAMVRGGGAVIDLIESLRISLQKRGVRYTAPARVISANTVGVSRTSGLASSTDSTGGYLDQPLTSRRRLAAGSRR